MATFTTTTKWALRWLTGSNVINDIDAGFQALAEDVDSKTAGYAEGTFAGKPAAAKAGRIYRCTDTGQWLADTGSAWVDLNAAPTLVSSLPVSPYDGQEIYYSADATNGVVWHLRYRSASASAYKWEFTGGGWLSSEVKTIESTSSGTLVDLTTVGPQVTNPLAGDYEVDISAFMNFSTAAGASAMAVPKFGAAAEDVDDRIGYSGGASSDSGTASRTIPKRTITAAGTLVKLRYSVTSGSVAFSRRTLAIRPIRVG